MGSVKELNYTGDNDPEIYPQQYYRHYLYCDNCGSFKISSWIEPKNHASYTKIAEKLDSVISVMAYILLYGAIIIIFFGLIGFIFSGSLDIGYILLLLIIIVGLPLFILFSIQNYFASKVKDFGVKCDKCGEKYENGSEFLTNLESNPKGFNESSLPKPRHNGYWVMGRITQ